MFCQIITAHFPLIEEISSSCIILESLKQAEKCDIIKLLQSGIKKIWRLQENEER